MVGNSALRKIVCADAFGAVTRAHEKFTLRSLLGYLRRDFGIEQSRLQQRHCACTILVLGALILAFDDDARRQVCQANG